VYKVLRSLVSDNGIDSDGAIQQASDDLARQVEAAEADGWEVSGGVAIYSRQRPHGLMTWMMQAMRKIPMQVEGTPKQVIDRMDGRGAPYDQNRREEHAEKNRKVANAAKGAT
jgi:hypothetical protein